MSLRFAGRALARSSTLVARRLGAFAATQGLGMAAALLPVVALVYTAEIGMPAPQPGESGFDRVTSAAPLVTLLLASVLSALALSIVAFGLGLVVADAASRGEPLDAFAAWDRLRPRVANLVLTQGLVVALAFGPLVVAALMAEAAGDPPDWLLVPLLLALLAGILVFLLGTSLSASVSVLERHAPADNLRRSWRLTRGEKGGVLLALAAFALVAAAGAWTADQVLFEDVALGLLLALALLALWLFAFTSLLVHMHRALRMDEEAPLPGEASTGA